MAVPFATDENFNRPILRGLPRRRPQLDVVTLQDAGLTGADDPFVLAWAATEGRVMLTHDGRTMRPIAYQRIAAGHRVAGVVVVDSDLSVGEAIEELVVLLGATLDTEWVDQVHHLPLR